jgi:hypothetical protein
VLLPNTYGTGFAKQDFKSIASIARGRWQVNGATVGGILSDRTAEGGGYNRIAGPDAIWFPTTEHRLRAQVLGSWTTLVPLNGALVKGDLESGHFATADWRFNNPKWDLYVNLEEASPKFRDDNGFVPQNGYKRIYSETARKFLQVGPFNEVSPYLNAEYKLTTAGDVQYQQNNLGLRLGLPRATTIWLEVRPNNLVAVQEGGGLRKRDQRWIGFESNPFPWLAKIYSELAVGDRVDVANNRVGKGSFFTVQLNMRPHPRAEVEYRIDNDIIDAIESVEGSNRIIHQRAQQLLSIWHFSARDSARVIWQEAWTRRSPSLWAQPVSAHEDQTTVSVVYGHRRGIGTNFYLGATFSRTRDLDLGGRAYQAEVFAKASLALDLL